jgi:hypothetical protein
LIDDSMSAGEVAEIGHQGADALKPFGGVRTGRTPEHGPPGSPRGESRLAQPSILFPLQLNGHWRVVDDPLQWILQRRSGRPRSKNSGCRGRFFFRTREGLLACVREYCGPVEDWGLASLKALPECHP